MRIGIDIGGTFTDFAVWASENDGYAEIETFKLPSTPEDYAKAVIDGVIRIIEAHGLAREERVAVVHGTTVGTNAVIERSQEPVALFVTQGYRDLLEFARLRLEKPMDLFVQRKAPLTPRELVFAIDERVDGQGHALRPVDPESVRAAAWTVLAKGIRKVAICLLHGYRQPQHEQEVLALLSREFPGLEAMASHEIWPQQGEYERAIITMLNLYVRDRMASYIERVEGFLAETLPNAKLFITRSNGGSMSAGEACRFPVHTLLSGPAAGVTGARHLCEELGLGDVLTMDMGGTSTDLSLISDGVSAYTAQAEIGDFPILLPVTAIEALGAGGGSILWADQKVLKLGPRSAGSFPGPACYGQGGQEPTLTDAFLLCGLLPAKGLLGGDLKLDVEKARAALDSLGETIGGVSAIEVAQAAISLANSEMLVKTLPFLARQGVEPQQLTLMVFGGAGGLQGPTFAWELGIDRIIVPRMTSVLCAYGCLVSDIVTDTIQSTHGLPLDNATVQDTLETLGAEGAAWVQANGGHRITHEWHGELRYPSQSFTLPISLSTGADEAAPPAILDAFQAAFHEEHKRLFGMAKSATAPRLDQLRVRTSSRQPRPAIGGASPKAGTGQAAKAPYASPVDHREVTLPTGAIERCPIFENAALVHGAEIIGPAILESRLATLLVPPGYTARAIASGDIWIEKHKDAAG